MKNKALVFVDTETSGLYPEQNHEILEVCCIKVYPNGQEEKLYLKALLESGCFSTVALELNGYRTRDWSGAVSQRNLAVSLAGFLKDCVLVGHNVQFDRDFIEETWCRFGIDTYLDRRQIDTQVLAFEHLVPLGLQSISMDSIRGFLGWSDSGNHTAIVDCEQMKQLYEYLLRFPWYRKIGLYIRLRLSALIRWVKVKVKVKV